MMPAEYRKPVDYHKSHFLNESGPSIPVILYSEIGPDLMETRRVSLFKDGQYTFTSEDHEMSITVNGERFTVGVAWERMPDIEQINLYPGVRAEEIEPEEFEAAWFAAKLSLK
jgi:hypothetical protein